MRVDGVAEVHDLHVWSISNDKHSFTCHLIIKNSQNGKQQEILKEVDSILRNQYELNHNTIQIELESIPETSE